MRMRSVTISVITIVMLFSGISFSGTYSGGNGSVGSPYQVANVIDFQEVSTTSTDWDKYFILTTDISLDGLIFAQSPIAPNTSTGVDFQGTKFTGIFDGNGHAISHLSITASGQYYIGLFGCVGLGGQIKNIAIEDVNITGADYVGGLVGFNYGTLTACHSTGSVAGKFDISDVGGLVGVNNGMLTNCYATGCATGNYYVGGLVGRNNGPLIGCYTTGSTTGYYSVGGLVGWNYYGTLTNCYTTGSVTGNYVVGGLVGENSNYGTLTGCYATGSVSAIGDPFGMNEPVGGLVGKNDGHLTDCCATGSVSGAGPYVGGLVGWNYSGTLIGCYSTGSTTGPSSVGGLTGYNYYGAISNCYATGSVSGIDFSCYIGGLVGYDGGGTLTKCYSAGLVSGYTYLGGLVGCSGGGTQTSCFWDNETSEQTVSSGAGATGKTTAEMKTQSTFTSEGWDFVGETINGTADIWKMSFISGYPILSWQTGLLSVNVPDVVGMTQAGAASAITSVGLVVGTVTTVYSNSVVAGNVISQSPAAGTTVNQNAAVDIEISLGLGSLSPWQLVSNMMTARDQFTGCVIGDKIYVFGGNGNPDGINLNSGEVYDINTSSWSSIASNTSDGIEELSGVGLNGKFYVFGGWGCDNPSGYCGVTNFNEMYDPDTDTWTTLSQKPTTTSSATPVVYDGKIYLFGGYYSDESPSGQRIDYAVVEAYDPATNSWQYITDMPELLFNPAIAVYGDFAYLIGGYDPSTDTISTEVMVYHFTSNTWTRDYCTTGDAGRVYSYAGPTPVFNGKAYIVGGGEGTSMADHWVTDSATVFDITAKTWLSLPKLPEPRSCHLTVMCDKTIYVIGGYDDENNINRAQSTVYTLTLNIADLNGNGNVYYDDLIILVNQWLQYPGNPSADIAPSPAGDGIVNFEDFALFASNWLDEGTP